MQGLLTASKPTDKAVFGCPRCGQPGRTVSPSTIEALLLPAARAQLQTLHGFQFCATAPCDVACFHPATGELVVCAQVCKPFFQKSTDPARLVCYWFGYTVASIQQEVSETGASPIAADIKARCTRGLHDCERTNPQGACCLGNVQQLIRQAAAANRLPPTAQSCCCH